MLALALGQASKKLEEKTQFSTQVQSFPAANH